MMLPISVPTHLKQKLIELWPEIEYINPYTINLQNNHKTKNISLSDGSIILRDKHYLAFYGGKIVARRKYIEGCLTFLKEKYNITGKLTNVNLME